MTPYAVDLADRSAKMADFGGWEMPIEYPGGGVVAEHTAVRERVGIFDVSHLGKARVSGTGAAELVNSTLTNDLGRIGPGKAQYTLCCNESGGVVDDLIAYVRSDFDVFLVPNAANTAAVVERLHPADGRGEPDLRADAPGHLGHPAHDVVPHGLPREVRGHGAAEMRIERVVRVLHALLGPVDPQVPVHGGVHGLAVAVRAGAPVQVPLAAPVVLALERHDLRDRRPRVLGQGEAPQQGHAGRAGSDDHDFTVLRLKRRHTASLPVVVGLADGWPREPGKN